MNRLSLANVIAFLVGAALLLIFLNKEGRLSRLFHGADAEDIQMESPRPAVLTKATEVKVAEPIEPLGLKPKSTPSPTPLENTGNVLTADLRKIPQFFEIALRLGDAWEIPNPDNKDVLFLSANYLRSEVTLRTKLFMLKPGEGILFQPKIESILDQLLRAPAAKRFKFESGRKLAAPRPTTESYCDLDLAASKPTDELHYEKIERGILIESTKVLLDQKGFSGVEIKGAVKSTKLLGKILSISCYIKNVAGVQRYQKLELIHLLYNLGSKGRLVPISKK